MSRTPNRIPLSSQHVEAVNRRRRVVVNFDVDVAAFRRITTGRPMKLYFDVAPDAMALGDNLLGVRVTERRLAASDPIQIEKVELRVTYRR